MRRLRIRSLLSTFILLALAVAPASAQSFSVLHSFTGAADGALPVAGMILDPAGNLYGAAMYGGTGTCFLDTDAPGCGTIFELKKHNGSYTFNPLYSFQGGTDGEVPVQPLTLGPNGTYYGTTFGGGEGTCNYQGLPECGVVFNAGASPTPQRTPLLKFREIVLYRFSGGSDGANPHSTVVFDQAGNMYGTTFYGGAHLDGTVFELSPAGGGAYTETVLYTFCTDPGCLDGSEPADGLVFDAAGNLYGTTQGGGSNRAGTVFELSPTGAGWTHSVIYSFQDALDGGYPAGGVAIERAGNLYGNTFQAGSGGDGTVYELTRSGTNWNFNLLYSVPRGNGSSVSRVTLDSSGNVYETLLGGEFGYGQVLELVRSGSNWTYMDLYDFTNGSDGSYPFGSVVLDSSGNLYGTTEQGGSTACGGSGCGVAWELTP